MWPQQRASGLTPGRGSWLTRCTSSLLSLGTCWGCRGCCCMTASLVASRMGRVEPPLFLVQLRMHGRGAEHVDQRPRAAVGTERSSPFRQAGRDEDGEKEEGSSYSVDRHEVHARKPLNSVQLPVFIVTPRFKH